MESGEHEWEAHVEVANAEVHNDTACELHPMCVAFRDLPSYVVPVRCTHTLVSLIVSFHFHLVSIISYDI